MKLLRVRREHTTSCMFRMTWCHKHSNPRAVPKFVVGFTATFEYPPLRFVRESSERFLPDAHTGPQAVTQSNSQGVTSTHILHKRGSPRPLCARLVTMTFRLIPKDVYTSLIQLKNAMIAPISFKCQETIYLPGSI